MNNTPKLQILFLIFIILLLVFTKLRQHPIEAWDEARNGVSAIEMLTNGDWINPYYKGEPDDWVAKPPLAIWCIAGSFSLFHFNEFALRLPAAIAIIIAFFFIFKIIRLYKSTDFAFYTLLILSSVNGLIGWHVGRTGDTDALLICFLIAGLYHFLRFYDFGKSKAIYWTGLLWGLAFMVKGPAMGVLLPGLLLYIVFSGGWKKVLYTKNTWLAVAIAAIFPVAWFLIIHFYGVTFENNSAGDNVVERLFIYDLWERFTENEAGWKKAFSFHFFFYSLDKLFNLWNYIFFKFLAVGTFLLIKNWQKWKSYLLATPQKLLFLSLCLYFPLAIFLTLAAKSHSWYLAPAIPFVGIVTYFSITILMEKNRWIFPIFIALLCFTIGRKFYDFYTPNEKPTIITEHWQSLAEAEKIAILGSVEQDILLYIYFANRHIYFPKKPNDLRKATVVFVNNSFLDNFKFQHSKIIEKTERYTILAVDNFKR